MYQLVWFICHLKRERLTVVHAHAQCGHGGRGKAAVRQLLDMCERKENKARALLNTYKGGRLTGCFRDGRNNNI